MKKAVLIFSISLALIIRILLLQENPHLSYDAYHTLLEITHIKDTGLPMQYDELGWQGSHDAQLPAYYYLLAILSIFLPVTFVALAIPNLLFTLLPIPVYMLTYELTRHRNVSYTVAIASVFVPLLYIDVLTSNPISLALPLLFASFYFFIRLGKTPKDQNWFVILTALLILTHPLSILLALAMGITLLFTTIQKLTFRKPLAEATLFTTFFGFWITLLVYKQPLQIFRSELIFATTQLPDFAVFITQVGVIPLLFGAYAAYMYLTEEKSLAGHALTALALATVTLILTGTISFTLGTLLLGITLLILGSGTLQGLLQARKRSRIPTAYTTGGALLVIIFLATSAIPATTFGVSALLETPTTQEQHIIATLQDNIEPGNVVLWDQKLGYYLQYAGYKTVWNANTYATVQQEEITFEIEQLRTLRGQIQYLRILQRNNIDVLVEPTNTIPITERCFTQLEDQEVYNVQCVIN